MTEDANDNMSAGQGIASARAGTAASCLGPADGSQRRHAAASPCHNRLLWFVIPLTIAAPRL